MRSSFCLVLMGLLGVTTVYAQQTDPLLREVVVTAQFAPTDVRSATHAVRILRRDRIERLGANNLEQLLRQELNLGIGQDMVLGSSLSMQGMSGQNVKILIDGVPVIGRQDGNIDLGQINLANVDRVELIEGPTSVYYGTDALAGVINLITRRSQLEPWRLSVNSQYETLGERSLGGSAGVRLGEKWLLLGSGGYDHFTGFDTSASSRNRLWNPKKQTYGDATLRYNGAGDHVFRLKGALFLEQVDNLGEVRRPQFKPYAFDEFYRTQRRDLAFLHEGSVGSGLFWNNTLGANFFYREKEARRTDLETAETMPLNAEQDTIRFNSYMLRSVLASQGAHRRWQWMAGIDGRYDTGSGRRILDTLNNTVGESAMLDAAVLGSLRFRATADLSLEAGLRAGWNSRYNGSVVPSFHIRQNLGEAFSLRASYARGFRSPDIKELFFYFVDVNHYIVGNADLRAETTDNVQATLGWQGKTGAIRWNAQVCGFSNWLRDKIELYEFVDLPGGGIEPAQGDTTTLRYTYFNIDQYRTHGATLRASAQWRGLRLEGATNRIGHYNPEHDNMPETPAFTYTQEWSGSVQWEHSDGWNAGVWARTTDRFVRYYPEKENGQTIARQRIINGFTQMDASVGKSMWNNRIVLTAGVRNLLDVQSTLITGSGTGNHTGGGTTQQNISPGRSWWLRATVAIGGKG
ncbi:MAG: TonB-dependent receptor [Saprospiraceae bacterium]|nr:TonB-dependent receptor [Saprospiraceae bacterium]